MDFKLYKPRKLMFKAWNMESRLLMRLNSIDCKRGELFKKDHILLQFTGLYDQQNDEIYEMDIMLMASEKYIVLWDEDRNGWNLAKLNNQKIVQPFVKENSKKTTRLWSYFESDQKS